MADRFDVSGRTALVTGASRGNRPRHRTGAGRTRRRCRDQPYFRVRCRGRFSRCRGGVGGRSAVSRGQGLRDRGRSVGRGARFSTCSTARVSALGRVDILVSNANIQIPCAFEDIAAEEIDLQCRMNYRVPIQLLQRALPPMAERGWGRVLAIGSVQQVNPTIELAVYAGLKSAQQNLVMNLSRQYVKSGVTINNLAPGLIDTDRNRFPARQRGRLAGDHRTHQPDGSRRSAGRPRGGPPSCSVRMPEASSPAPIST